MDKQLTYLYIIISVAGLYTFYSYLFVITFQFLFVLLASKKNLRSLILIGLSYGVIILLFIPWITPMLEGINNSQMRDDYFKGTYSLLIFLRRFFDTNIFLAQYLFTSSSQLFLNVIVIVLTVFLSFIYLVGIYKSLKADYSFAFVTSLLVFFLLVFVTDKILTTRSLVIEKHQYFIVPVLLFLLSVGTYFITSRIGLRFIIFSSISIFLISGFYYRFQNKSFFDGPYFFKPLTLEIQEVSANYKASEVLILYNTNIKRFLLPFINEITRNFDIMILPKGVTLSILEKVIPNRYKQLLVVNVTIPYEKRMQ